MLLKVFLPAQVDGRTWIAIADMFFDKDNRPFAILHNRPNKLAETAPVRVFLNPKYLHRLPPGDRADYYYERPAPEDDAP